MENVKPAGTNRLSYLLDNSTVVFWLMGNTMASAFTPTIMMYENKPNIDFNFIFIL
jgi:hypothetical protein